MSTSMNDFYSVLTELLGHSYYLVIWTSIILIPAKMLFNAFLGKPLLR